MSFVRTIAGAVAGLALVAVGGWAVGPSRVVAPGVVVPARVWEVRHAGDGALRWAVRDGSQPGGPVALAEGVLLAERGGQLELRLAEGIEQGARVVVDQPMVHASRPAMRARTEAQLAASRAAAAEVEALAQGDRAGPVVAAEAQVRVAQASLARAQRAAEVSRALAENGGAAAWEAELAVLEVGVQEAAVRAAHAAVAQARNLPRDAELEAGRARVEAASAAAEEARIRAAEAPLRAPLAGRVEQPGGEVVVSVVSEETPLVQAALPEVHKAAWAPGTRLSFVPTGGTAVEATVLRRADQSVPSAAGPRVWVVAQLAAPVPVGSTGVLRSPDRVGGS